MKDALPSHHKVDEGMILTSDIDKLGMNPFAHYKDIPPPMSDRPGEDVVIQWEVDVILEKEMELGRLVLPSDSDNGVMDVWL